MLDSCKCCEVKKMKEGECICVNSIVGIILLRRYLNKGRVKRKCNRIDLFCLSGYFNWIERVKMKE